MAKIGVPNTRRILAQRPQARRPQGRPLGLLDEAVSSPAELDPAIEREVAAVLLCAPSAVATAKRLIRYVSTHGFEENLSYTAGVLAHCWRCRAARGD